MGDPNAGPAPDGDLGHPDDPNAAPAADGHAGPADDPDADPAADDTSELRVVDVPEGRRYEAYLGDELAGFVTYRLLPGRIVLIHTEIDPRSQGKGTGSQLAAAVLDDVRARGLLITPRCPFIRSFIARRSEYADLVVPDTAASP